MRGDGEDGSFVVVEDSFSLKVPNSNESVGTLKEKSRARTHLSRMKISDLQALVRSGGKKGGLESRGISGGEARPSASPSMSSERREDKGTNDAVEVSNALKRRSEVGQLRSQGLPSLLQTHLIGTS